MQTPRERRSSERAAQRLLKRDLNDAQLDTLAAIERFGWELKFVRRPPFQPVIPVVFDGGGQRHAVIESDGRLNESPGLVLRP